MNESVAGFNRYLLLPNRDKSGRLQFLDMNHILHWTGVGAPPAPGVTPFDIEDGPSWAQFPMEIVSRELYGNPVVSTFGPPMFNKDPYTGKSSYGPGQPHEGFWGAVGDRAFKTFTPSLFPGNVGYDKMAGAIKGRPDYFGFPSSLGETLFSQSTGLNLRHFDPATEERFRNKEFRDAAEEIRKGMYSAAADQRLSQEERENRLNELSNRMDRLVRKYSSLGGEGPVAQSGTAIAPARKSTGSDWVDQMLK